MPVGYWTEDFKEHLEVLIEPVANKDGKKNTPVIKDYDDMSKDTNVDFTITFVKGKLVELESIQHDNGCNGVDKLLKLFKTNTTTNMHLFNAEDKLKKYEKVEEIIDDYYITRFKLYEERKKYLIKSLEREIVLLSNKAKYINEILEGTIDLRKKKKDDIIKFLQDKGYQTIDEDGEYKYLVKMPMDSVSEENVSKLFKELGAKEAELETIRKTTVNNMWLNELDILKKEYLEYKEDRQRLMSGAENPKKKQPLKKFNKNMIIVEE